MVAAILKPEKTRFSENGSLGYGGPGGGEGFSPPGGGDEVPGDAGQIGLLFFLATVTMLFAGVASALLIRKASSDWHPISFPPILFLNTAILIVSSLTLEFSRSAIKRSARYTYQLWISLTALLGIVFLTGQITAWRMLVHQGIFLSTNPHASFFYLLTGLHAIHLFGGVVILLVACRKAWSALLLARQKEFFKLVGMYWHFLDLLWIAVLWILFVW